MPPTTLFRAARTRLARSRLARSAIARAVVAAWLALAVGLAGWIVLPTLAEARPQDRHGPHGAVVDAEDGAAELGQFQLGDLTVWCIDLNSWGPKNASGWVSTRTDRIRKQTTFGDRGGHTDVAGELVDRAELAELAWVLEWAEQHVDNDAAAIAVDHFIRLRTVGDAAQGERMQNRLTAARALFPNLDDQLADLERRVDAEAGPYRVQLRLDAESGRGTAAVVGRADTPIPGREIVVTIDGREQTLTAGDDGRAHFDLPEVESGRVEVAAAASVPGSIPVLHTARHYDDENHDDYRIQRMLSAGTPATVTAHDSFRVGADTPTVVTVASTPRAAVGDELHDMVRVTGARHYAGTATATLWGPYTDQPGKAACREEDTRAGRVEFAVRGDGSYETPTVAVDEPGFYTWTVTLPAANGSREVTTRCGVEAETIEVAPTPRIVTDVLVGGERSDRAALGAAVRDRVEVTGFAGRGRVVATLWGPYPTVPGRDQCRVGDPHAGRVEVAIDGSDTYTTPAVRPTEPGHYVWTIELTADTLPRAATTPCGDRRETVRLLPPQTPPGETPPRETPPTSETPTPPQAPPGETPTPPAPPAPPRETPTPPPAPRTGTPPASPTGTPPAPPTGTPPAPPTGTPPAPPTPSPLPPSSGTPTPPRDVPPPPSAPASGTPAPPPSAPASGTPTPTPSVPIVTTSPGALGEVESPIRVRSGA